MNNFRVGYTVNEEGILVEVVREVNDQDTEEMIRNAERTRRIRYRVGTPLCTKGKGKKAGRGNWIL